MHYYNAIQAARYIGVDPKTVRRWLKKGILTAERTEQGWLAIPGGQVEYAKIKWEEEQAKFARPWLSNAPLPEQTRDDMDIPTRVEVLEQRVAFLEQALSNASLHSPTQPQAPLYRFKTDREEATTPRPQKRIVAPSTDLPDGSIGLSDFAAQHGISLSSASRWARNGDIPTEQRTRAGRPQHFLTQEQQEQAIEWLRLLGKIE